MRRRPLSCLSSLWDSRQNAESFFIFLLRRVIKTSLLQARVCVRVRVCVYTRMRAQVYVNTYARNQKTTDGRDLIFLGRAGIIALRKLTGGTTDDI